MSKIKTALEIALERAEGIETDPEQEKRERLLSDGKRLAGSYLTDIDTTFESVQEKYRKIDPDQKELIRDGIRETILANISLPQSDLYVETLGKLKKLASLLSENPSAYDDLFVQLDGLYTQYLQNRDQLESRLLEQFRPQLEQKQRMIQQQTGQNVELRPEQDKEFIQVLQDSYKRLDQQFQEVLDQLKDQLSQLTQ
jgi:hypothetical protein